MSRGTMIRILTPSDYVRMPWRNAGGVTTEIARAPSGEGSDFRWRVSIADVAEDGAFSTFPGIDRLIMVIAGAGMDLLRPDGSVLRLDPFVMRSFAGEDAFVGRLRAGPVRDFNVMVRRGHSAARMALVIGPATIPHATPALLHALSGAWQIDGAAVPPGCTAVLDGATLAQAPSGARAVLVILQKEGEGAALDPPGPAAPDPQ